MGRIRDSKVVYIIRQGVHYYEKANKVHIDTFALDVDSLFHDVKSIEDADLIKEKVLKVLKN